MKKIDVKTKKLFDLEETVAKELLRDTHILGKYSRSLEAS